MIRHTCMTKMVGARLKSSSEVEKKTKNKIKLICHCQGNLLYKLLCLGISAVTSLCAILFKNDK